MYFYFHFHHSSISSHFSAQNIRYFKTSFSKIGVSEEWVRHIFLMVVDDIIRRDGRGYKKIYI